jgi:hypothetical protein
MRALRAPAGRSYTRCVTIGVNALRKAREAIRKRPQRPGRFAIECSIRFPERKLRKFSVVCWVLRLR